MNPYQTVEALTLALNEVLKELQKQTILLNYIAERQRELCEALGEEETTKEAGKE